MALYLYVHNTVCLYLLAHGRKKNEMHFKQFQVIAANVSNFFFRRIIKAIHAISQRKHSFSVHEKCKLILLCLLKSEDAKMYYK